MGQQSQERNHGKDKDAAHSWNYVEPDLVRDAKPANL
jgi:hypothetical protein